MVRLFVALTYFSMIVNKRVKNKCSELLSYKYDKRKLKNISKRMLSCGKSWI